MTALEQAIDAGRQAPAMSEALEIIAQPATRSRIEERVRLAGTALRDRYGETFSSAEVDLIFAHYLLGLVSVLYPNVDPESRLLTLRHLALVSLGPDEVQCALHAQPPDEFTFVGRALKAAELIGERHGEEFVAA